MATVLAGFQILRSHSAGFTLADHLDCLATLYLVYCFLSFSMVFSLQHLDDGSSKITFGIPYLWETRLKTQSEIWYPPTLTWEMDRLRQCRIDVYSENQLNRYEQLFELRLTSVVLGLGVRQSIQFVTYFTVQDLCIFRCTCFAIAVDLHDTLEDLTEAPYNNLAISGQMQCDVNSFTMQ